MAEMGQNWDFRALFSEIYMKIEVFSRLEHNYTSAPIAQLAASKSLYRSRAGSHFYGTEIEIWVDFGPVGNTENKLLGRS